MTVNILLMVLVASLVLLFAFFIYFYLKKDSALLDLKSKYDQMLMLESERMKINRQRDDYVAMMVHELRSPLAVMKGSADLVLKEDKSLSDDQKYTLLSQIIESSTDLLDIVNDILDVSKIESGRFEINKKLGSINKLLEDEAKYYMALAAEKEIEVVTKLDEHIEEFEFDTDRVKHVLNNLLSNALKFTDQGGKVTIYSNYFEGDMVEISVVDTGLGVPDHMKGKLFNKFVQMENRGHSKEKGTGLGLVIAKGIVEAHGGTIWVEDSEPEGAKFIFTLPFKS